MPVRTKLWRLGIVRPDDGFLVVLLLGFADIVVRLVLNVTAVLVFDLALVRTRGSR